MHYITKEFDFCYGHRVHNQVLNQEYSIDNQCVCRHLHGHQGKITVFLSSDTLTNGMVTDFKHLNWFKKFVDDTIDHKFIIDMSDPLYDILIPPNPEGFPKQPGLMKNSDDETFWKLDLIDLKLSIHMRELYEGFIIVDFVPTSENISKWLHGIIQKKMAPLNVKVDGVEFKETPKTGAIYNDRR